VVDPELAWYIPAAAQALAGIDLARMRRTPAYSKGFALMRELVGPFADAEQVVLVFDGKGVAAVARGGFRAAPPGGVLLKPGIAALGSLETVAGDSRGGYARDLLARAGEAAGRYPIWFAIRGSATLPLSGNLTNLNRLIGSTVFTTAGIEPAERLAIEAAGICRTAEEARRLEETIRGLVTLLSITKSAAGLKDLTIRNEGTTVRVTMSADASLVGDLGRALGGSR